MSIKRILVRFSSFLIIMIFGICICIPVHLNAQVLPTWALNPWGNTLGLGRAATPPYTVFNTAAAFSPWVPFTPYPPAPFSHPFLNPVYGYGYGFSASPTYLSPLATIPPTPTIRAAATTITLVLPSATLVPGTVPATSTPVISTTEFAIGLLLTIGHDSGLFYTNPALFWYLVGILY